jgi:hypothetical protein
MKNNLRTYIIEPTNEPSIFLLLFGTPNGDTFKFELMGHVSVLPKIQKFEFNIKLELI